MTDAGAAHMRRALELARNGWGLVHPNPLVGAVVVKDGRIVGEGWHRGYGGAHAEVEALRDAGPDAQGATLYVTLEPCAHHGKTPPCTDAVIAAGVSRVVYAAQDPNPRAGGGAARLAAAGIAVMGGVDRAAARSLNAAFFHVHERGAPFVALKLALSLDGRIAARAGARTQITGPAALREVHRLRAGFDAVLIGRNTARTDDPLLTVRDVPCRTPPVRVVLDSEGRLDPRSRLVRTTDVAPLWIVTGPHADPARVRSLVQLGVHTVTTTTDTAGDVDAAAALRSLAASGIRSILVEGGARVAASLLGADLVHRLYLFVAPRLLGAGGVQGLEPTRGFAPDWRLSDLQRFDDDVLLTCDRAEVD